MSPAACVTFAVLLTASTAFAQPPTFGQRPAAPPRDATGAEPKGTAVLRGRVFASDTGRPLRRARVTLTAPELGASARKTASTSTDGVFEFKELPAARYRISVTRSGYLPLEYGQRRPGELGRPVEIADGQTLEKVDIALPRMGVITGRIVDEAGEPIEGVTVMPMRAMYFEGRRTLVPVGGTVLTDDQGEYRLLRLAPGTYFVMATTKETWTVVEAGRQTILGYLPTYFPGVPSSGDARRIAVGVGQEVPAIDISLLPGRTARVSGRATDSQGRPFTRVSMTEEIRGQGFGSFRGGPSATVAADGTFTIPNVAPGEYTLSATRPIDDPAGPPEVAITTVNVDGTDIDNIVLSGSGGGTVTGRVIVEEGSPKMSAVRVVVGPALRNQPSPSVLGAFRNAGSATVAADGAFTASNVLGRSRFQITAPEGFMVKAVTQNGRDISDDIVELKNGEQMSDVQIVLTNRVSSISGQLMDDKNAPVADATVLVFPADREKWYESSARVRPIRPDQKGEWRVKGLPKGEYLAIALEYIEDGAWHDPEYLEQLRRDAQKVTVDDGASKTVALKLVVPKG